MRVIVCDGEQRSSLAATRSLIACGHQVLVGAVKHPCLAGLSRGVAGVFSHADPQESIAAFAKDLADQCRRFSVDLVIPMTDATSFAIATEIQRHGSNIPVFMPSLDTLQLAADKSAVFQLAQKLDIPVPDTIMASRPEPLPPGLRYPLVIKPRRSRIVSGAGFISLGVTYARDPEEARHILRELPEGAFPVLLQEKLSGEGVGYFALAKEGRILAEFQHRRLRELPPTGGVSVLREAMETEKALEEPGRKLLKELGWTGPAMVEFKRDGEGRPRIMEINGRFWGSLQLAVDAGVDFPRLLVMAFQGEDFPAPVPRVGTRSRYLLGDLESLAVVLAKGPSRFPSGSVRRWDRLWSFISEGGKPELLRLGDPRPFIHDLGIFLKKAVILATSPRDHRGLRGIIHCHTTFSYDGHFSLERLVRHLEIRGLSFAAITEHARSMNAAKMSELCEACRTLSGPGMVLLPGIEFATERGTHILGIGIWSFFVETDPLKIVQGIHQRGGVAILAHPDNSEFERDAAFLEGLDGVEVWNAVHDGPFAPSTQNIEAFLTIRRANPRVLPHGGADFHTPGHYRGMHLEIEGAEGPEEIISALKNGKYRVRGRFFSFLPEETFSPGRRAYVRLVQLAVQAGEPFVGLWRSVKKKVRDTQRERYGAARLLHTIETGNPGGAENMMLSLVDNLPMERFRSRFMLVKSGWLHEQVKKRGLAVDLVRLRSLVDIRFVFRLVGICRRHRTQIVHSHEFYTNTLGALAAKLFGCAHVAVIHGNLDYLRPLHRRLFYRAGLALGSKFVTVSYALQEDLARRLRVPRPRILVIHNGVPVSPLPDRKKRAEARRLLGIGESPSVAIIGSLYQVKGHHVLLDAMPELLLAVPDLKCLFIGRGVRANTKALREKAAPFGDAVIFYGYRDRVDELLPGIDVLALPSDYEGLSLSLCEAMIMGIPAVATRVGGNPEVISDGRDGFLVPPRDPKKLAEKLCLLLTDPVLRRQMGRSARTTIIEGFSIDQMIRNYTSLYEEILP